MADVDFREWDWLPHAAKEAKGYMERLLTEAAINAHVVSARAKSITSFQEKCDRKEYAVPCAEVTDTVAVRIITYSLTDRDRAAELIRDRFKCTEDINPGTAKSERRRGYDCQHFIVTGESTTADSGWLIAGGELAKYFDRFGGLEIQIRTVAAHAWAEFEHARRYKGQSYEAISDHDQQTVDQLFGAASDARRALDETFVAIDRVLANPRSTTTPSPVPDDQPVDPEETARNLEDGDAPTPVDSASLRDYLSHRFPDDSDSSERGMQFACELVHACGLESIEGLSAFLDVIDSEQVRKLMDTTTTVTRVRRLDDELLARLGETYIRETGDIGEVRNRAQQLQWRFDRVRDKVSVIPYKGYELVGMDCPDDLRNVPMPAARAVREVARIVGGAVGLGALRSLDGMSESPDHLLPSTRPREVEVTPGHSLWVATNLRREASEAMLSSLLQVGNGLDLQVVKDGSELPHA